MEAIELNEPPSALSLLETVRLSRSQKKKRRQKEARKKFKVQLAAEAEQVAHMHASALKRPMRLKVQST